MGIFSNIVSKLFGHSTAQAAPASAAASTGPAATPAATAAAGGAAAGAATAPSPTALVDVDVAQILDGLVARHGEKLDWRRSIVDLLKALDLDSSLSARKELAHELHYTGSTDDTATMNVWLIKQVLQKLKENGGKLPADLTS
ncbi:DUF3597 domain-containing protein [Methylocella sp.]|uniref:DUF3597 domain-containing protein n=1 Tax=Methylocella sp. TaxID=1978226 RepID=UPI0035B2EFA2